MKKYYGKLKGKKIVIPEPDWHQLRERYDVKLAVEYGKDEYRIPVACPLCDDYLVSSCRGCTLNKFRNDGTTSEGCANVLELILGERSFPFGIDVSCVSWDKNNDEKARKAVRKLYRELGKMKLREV